MSGAVLWAVSTRGNVYTLSSNENHWKQIRNQQNTLQGFKKVIPTAFHCYGLGCDHQIFVYVPTSDLPIRSKVETYENERWLPACSWSGKNLIPVLDPFHWSSEDGYVDLQKENIQLPTDAWIWESEWYVDENVKGHPTNKGGWRYSSIDFKHSFSHEMCLNSCVRRRRWIRFMKYNSFDQWIWIPSIHLDPLEEPITEISVGGHEIPFQEDGYCILLVITVNGRVLIRSGITRLCPEGKVWNSIDLPHNQEALSISITPSGVVWFLTWNNRLFVCAKIEEDSNAKSSWTEIDVPDCTNSLSQISVGFSCVWLTSAIGQVWFRKGVNTETDCIHGTGWVSMTDLMRSIIIGSNDCIWAIGYDDSQIYYRAGVTQNEPTGQSWWKIKLPYRIYESNESLNQLNTCTSMKDLTSDHGCFDSESDDRVFLNKEQPSGISFNESPDVCLKSAGHKPELLFTKSDTNLDKAIGFIKYTPFYRKTKQVLKKSGLQNNARQLLFKIKTRGVEEEPNVRFKNFTDSQDVSFTSENSLQIDSISLSGSSENLSLTSMTKFDNFQHILKEESESVSWMWTGPVLSISINPHTVKKWTLRTNTSHKVSYFKIGIWRSNILASLQDRNANVIKNFGDYHYVIDKSLWTKKSNIRIFIETSRSPKWVACKIELSKSHDHLSNDGTLSISSDDKSENIDFIVLLDKVTIFQWVYDLSITFPRLDISIHPEISMLLSIPIIRIAFMSENEIEDWLKELTSSSLEQKNIYSTIALDSIWMTTNWGDIFVHQAEPDILFENLNEMFWHKTGGHMKKIESTGVGITWGISFDGSTYFYNGGYSCNFFRNKSHDTCHINDQIDSKFVHIFENQRWRPLLGFTHQVLFSDHYEWSDESGKNSLTKDSFKLPSLHWQWMNDWQIDPMVSGGVDSSGWQYSHNFNSKFTSKCHLRSYVRRRRWARNCKLHVCGPWSLIETVKLVDVSIQGGLENDDDTIAVWAVSSSGDILFRDSVTKDNIGGVKWVHIPTDQFFISVCMGMHMHIWAIAKDGSAWLRCGVTKQCKTGLSWCQIAPPKKNLLKKVVVGDCHVWALDYNNNLYFRNSVSLKCPEGESWSHIDSSVYDISLGFYNQLWAILIPPNSTNTFIKYLAYRIEYFDNNPKSGSWSYGPKGDWETICIRAWKK